MANLILFGLILVVAKLWFEVGRLKARVVEFEAARIFEDTADAAYPVYSVNPVEPTAVAPLAADDVPEPLAAPMLAPVDQQSDEEQPAIADEHGTAPRFAIPRIGFEELFGRKLPIWAGGATLAVASFLIVKYSIEVGLLRPIVRVILGLLFGTALIAGAELALRKDELVRDARVRQALAGAGVATLYASILVAANLYHLIGPMTAFVGMALTTALAGGLSLRFGAPSAVLGLIGGLAAPALVGSTTPDVPLLSAYLALAVAGLCGLSRSQRWGWLGIGALVGGFGWGGLMIVSGALDSAASLSIGALLLLLGILLPALSFAGPRNAAMRLLASLAACIQLAVLVALGGFGMLQWGLFALISIALVWLVPRDAKLRDLSSIGLTVAILLLFGWPSPPMDRLAFVIAGMTTIYGGAAGWRIWRDRARLADAGEVAALAIAIMLVPAFHYALADRTVALLALLGAGLAGVVAFLGWSCPTRRDDGRFAIVTTTVAALVALALAAIAPAWAVAPAIAIVAVLTLCFSQAAADWRIERNAWGFGAMSLCAATIALHVFALRAVGLGDPGTVPDALRWLVPALGAAIFAWRGRIRFAGRIAQPIAVLFFYVGVAQLLPHALLPLVPAAMLAGFTLDRRLWPALMAATALVCGWAAIPFGTWLIAAFGSLVAVPVFVSALPTLHDTVLRLAVPALALALAARRSASPLPRLLALCAAATLATISAHIAYKHLFAIADLAGFVREGLAERTMWEALLGIAALAALRRARLVAYILAAASLGHFLLFSALYHNPLWAHQAVGDWPVLNLLLPAYALAFAILWAAGRVDLPPVADRARGGVQMALIILFAASSLRQLIHGSLLVEGMVGQGEDIARSVLLILLALGFLGHGIQAGKRDWRIASLVLMLAAVTKVFLFDASGLDGVMRIGSFAALGFSLIGLGWLYARYLPDASGLTEASHLPPTTGQGE